MQQPTLWNYLNQKPAPERLKYVVGSETSQRAAEQLEGRASKTLRARVYRFLLGCQDGATDERIQLRLDMNPSTERPRRIELVEAGLVKDSGRKLPTQSGRMAVVWVCRVME